jgi:uncharacterized repeat protein (TIGR01451 family)
LSIFAPLRRTASVLMFALVAFPAAAQMNVTLAAMSFAPASITPGGQSTLSITFANATGATVSGVTFTDTLPAGLTSSAVGTTTFSPGCVFQSNLAVDNVTVYGNVSVAANSTCTVQAIVSAAGSGLYTNGAANISNWNGSPLSFPDATLSVTDGPVYQGLWWVPGGAETGWGLNLVHQGDQIYATWYTYDTGGKAWWLSMLAARTSPASNTYSGTIYVNVGPSFNNFPGAVVLVAVGTGTLGFSDADNGTFMYDVNGVVQTKSITRFDLATGPQPVCVYSAMTPNYAVATNYQDLWWVPNGAESGWGINFAHQGDTIFATWYTYGIDDNPLWLAVLARRQGTSNVYSGTVYQTSGPRFDSYDASKLKVNSVGSASFTFADGNHAAFTYSVTIAPFTSPIAQTKQLTRYLFSANGGTYCQ